jgi:hypothetical protein
MKLNRLLGAALTLVACSSAGPSVWHPSSKATELSLPSSSPATVGSTQPSQVIAQAEAPPSPPVSKEVVAEQPLSFVELSDSPGDERLTAAAAQIKAGKWFKARLELQKILPELERSAGQDVLLAAHALLARACLKQSDRRCAQREYQQVRSMWQEPAARTEQLAEVEGDEQDKQARLARALMAVGEAWFYAGEEKRLLAEEELFPVYRGKGDKESVFKHINTKLSSWLKARRQLLNEAEAAYVSVARLKPSPPPYWIIASSSRVGQMWNKFVLEFRSAPIPKEWAGVGPLPGSTVEREELRDTYYAAIDEASEPYQKKGHGAFQVCQDHAQKTSIHNEYSMECERWLEKHPQLPDSALGAVP